MVQSSEEKECPKLKYMREMEEKEKKRKAWENSTAYKLIQFSMPIYRFTGKCAIAGFNCGKSCYRFSKDLAFPHNIKSTRKEIIINLFYKIFLIILNFFYDMVFPKIIPNRFLDDKNYYYPNVMYKLSQDLESIRGLGEYNEEKAETYKKNDIIKIRATKTIKDIIYGQIHHDHSKRSMFVELNPWIPLKRKTLLKKNPLVERLSYGESASKIIAKWQESKKVEFVDPVNDIFKLTPTSNPGLEKYIDALGSSCIIRILQIKPISEDKSDRNKVRIFTNTEYESKDSRTDFLEMQIGKQIEIQFDVYFMVAHAYAIDSNGVRAKEPFRGFDIYNLNFHLETGFEFTVKMRSFYP